jgi:hypothetical protein
MEVTGTIRLEVDKLAQAGYREPYLLYAMGLRLRTLDYDTFQTDCLLDGGDDKKVDFFHLDLDTGVGTVAQSYASEDWNRMAAPSNKASDLNTALNWLLESELDEIPRDDVRAAATELRDGLQSGEIGRLDVFYVHNLPASDNVEAELGTAQRAGQRLLEQYSKEGAPPPECSVREASIEIVDEWRRSQHEAVSIEDQITLKSLVVPQKIETPEWRAALVTLPASVLVNLRLQYGDALFSANVRDYLGSRQSSRNINRQIERTVENQPANFWVFNNGITVLTRDFNLDRRSVNLQGIAIINGAQTTGSLAEAAARGKVNLDTAHVMVRIIKCNDPSLVDDVIRYNNTQNPIKAWELRVIDPVQRKLTQEFETLGITYQTRRGQSRRRGSDVIYEKLGPYLAAFYGDPGAAHRNKADLFENEGRYRQLFAEDTHVKNLLFIYRLGNAVSLAKTGLKQKVVANQATDDERTTYDYFRYGAFQFVVIYVCARVLGLWLEALDTRYLRRVSLQDKTLLDQAKSEEILRRVVEAVLIPIRQYVQDGQRDAYQAFRLQSGVDALANHARTLVQAVEQMQPDNYQQIKAQLVLADT